MNLVLALSGGLVALTAAYAGNTLIWRIFRGRGTVWLVPTWEELTKTALGLLTGQLLATHVIFGLGEAGLEMRRYDWIAGGLALSSHTLFGLVTLLFRSITGFWPLGWLAAVGVHLAWNLLVLRFSRH